MEKHNSTAAAAPCVTAADTPAICPVASPQRILAATIPIHKIVIAIHHPPSHTFMRGAVRYDFFCSLDKI